MKNASTIEKEDIKQKTITWLLKESPRIRKLTNN